MELDVNYIAAQQAIKNLEKLLFNLSNEKRKKLSNKIIKFSIKMEKKYK